MIYHLENNRTIIDTLRRRWRKGRQFTVRVSSSGTVSVMRMPLHRDMKTEAQIKCRQRFMQAQQHMLEAFDDKKKMRYFQKKRLQQGYKTLRGCMMAYYIDMLIRREHEEEQRATSEKMREMLRDVVKSAEIDNVEEKEREVLGMRLEDRAVVNIIEDDGLKYRAIDKDIGDGS